MARIDRTESEGFDVCVGRGDTTPVPFTVTKDGSAVDITGWSFTMTGNTHKNPEPGVVGTELFSIVGVIVDALLGTIQFPPGASDFDQVPARHYYDVQAVDDVGKKQTGIKAVFEIVQDISKG